ncbi:MAG TPA: hypothetical protein VKA42_07540 [Acidimicrobiales bacterium]|nr:hypothetical protein [Acidimicrobiales bacterium]
MPDPPPQRFRARLDSAGDGGAAFAVPPERLAALERVRRGRSAP